MWWLVVFLLIYKVACADSLFRLPDLDGEKFVVSEEFVGKTTFLLFVSKTCVPCLRELASLDEIFADRAKDVNLVVISTDNKRDTEKLFAKIPISDDVRVLLLGRSNLMSKLNNNKGILPFTVVLNSKADVCKVIYGTLEDGDIGNLVSYCDDRR